MIGSREMEKAERVAKELGTMIGQELSAGRNETVAEACNVAILATPALADEFMSPELVRALNGKLVISATVPMKFENGVYTYSLLNGSATERAAGYLKASRVVGAFHTVPAPKLLNNNEELDYDVLVAAETRDSFIEASPIISSVKRLRPLYAGSLSSARLIESLTPLILNVGKLNGIKSPSLRLV
jgi:NADPH-dependent F420 reductase